MFVEFINWCFHSGTKITKLHRTYNIKLIFWGPLNECAKRLLTQACSVPGTHVYSHTKKLIPITLGFLRKLNCVQLVQLSLNTAESNYTQIIYFLINSCEF